LNSSTQTAPNDAVASGGDPSFQMAEPMFDYLIIGAGFSGATLAERIASELDKKVLVVERRNHVGGNAYDYFDNDRILVSRYGAHIFHTNDERVWKYVNQFATFNNYVHTVDACIGDEFYSLPLNIDTINAFFHTNLSSVELPDFLANLRVPIKCPSNAEEAVVSQVGWELYEAFYRKYTLKQWGVAPKLLDASVTARLPVRLNNDKRYFSDRRQGVPVGGYTELFRKMLSHKNIVVLLDTDYRQILSDVRFNEMIFTGPIDLFFEYVHGKLPYRSIEFRFETIDREFYQHTAVVNYPNNHDYTRCVEYKYLNQQQHPRTSISRDYPCWNDDEPYYPVPTYENRLLYQRYKAEAEKLQSVYFCGRLGTYQYYNMDQCIKQALMLFENVVSKNAVQKVVSRVANEY
jgi:UDP-galactopyranose mutase